MTPRFNLILVAGHAIGGDPGAVGQGTTEAIECAQIVDRVYEKFVNRTDVAVDKVPHELDYIDSTKWINQRYAFDNTDTVVIEVHLNAPAVASGTETLIPGSDATTTHFGNCIQNALIQQTGLPNRGVKVRTDLYLITQCNPLACLVEARFIGVDDNSDLADEKTAQGIANGLCDFWGIPRTQSTEVIPPAPTPEPEVAPQDNLYRVMSGTKQLGAYKLEKNAYNKHVETGGDIFFNGVNITSEVVVKYTQDETFIIPSVDDNSSVPSVEDDTPSETTKDGTESTNEDKTPLDGSSEEIEPINNNGLEIITQVANNKDAKELSKGLPKGIKLFLYIIGDLFLLAGAIMGSIFTLQEINDVNKLNACITICITSGIAILTFVGIYKPKK